jgi:hypothetical protein
MSRKDKTRFPAMLAPANDDRSKAVQSGDHPPHAVWSRQSLIPLVRYLARRAAAEDFEKAANDNRRSSTL